MARGTEDKQHSEFQVAREGTISHSIVIQRTTYHASRTCVYRMQAMANQCVTLFLLCTHNDIYRSYYKSAQWHHRYFSTI